MEKTPVLLVDDEPDFLEAARLSLESGGYTVITAPDAESALEIARIREISMAVVDVNLPGMDGFELCRALRRSHPGQDLPVLFLSVRQEMRDMVQGIASGALDYLTKPIGRLELVAAVKRALAA